MKQTWRMKLSSWLGGFVRRISNHYYGCCDSNWKNCNKCKHTEERERDISRSEMWDKTLDAIAREIERGEI